MREGDKTFLIHWLHSEPTVCQGRDIAEAMSNAGIGRGALPAVDYYEEVVEPEVVEGILKEIEGEGQC